MTPATQTRDLANPYAAPVRTSVLPRGPEPLPLAGVELATPGLRLAARIVDNILYYLPLLTPIAVMESFAIETAWAGVLLGGGALAFLVLALVQAILVTDGGATIGKRLFGLKIIRHDGSDVGFLHGWFIRTFVYGVVETIAGTMLFYIPYFVDALMILTRHGQTLHDRIAGTYVIKVK